jgi:hypothetical protein
MKADLQAFSEVPYAEEVTVKAQKIATARQLPRPLREIGSVALSAGWKIEKNGHLKWRNPSGQLVVTSFTASEYRALENIKKDLRKAGLSV